MRKQPVGADAPSLDDPCGLSELRCRLGPVDIYWLDQWLRGRVRPGMTLLDAGCGGGRNLRFLLRGGEAVYGIDLRPEPIEALRAEGRQHGLSEADVVDRFRTGSIDSLPWSRASFDVVLCNAVLHFAPDLETFDRWLAELWRVLRQGGVFIARLASDIGIEDRVQPLGGRRFALPDGSERFLVDEDLLLERQESLGAELIDPIKTTVVQGKRCMTTWVLRRP